MERKLQEQESTIKKEEFVIKPTFKPHQNQPPRSYDEVTYDWHDHTEHILVFFFLVMSQLNSKCKGH